VLKVPFIKKKYSNWFVQKLNKKIVLFKSKALKNKNLIKGGLWVSKAEGLIKGWFNRLLDKTYSNNNYFGDYLIIQAFGLKLTPLYPN